MTPIKCRATYDIFLADFLANFLTDFLADFLAEFLANYYMARLQMLETQPRLSTGYLVLLSLPTAAVGFFLSAITASLSWILSTRYGLHIDNNALIWLAGPLARLLVQPLLGFLSDRTWILGSRRKPYLLVGGLTGTASLLALLKLNDFAAYTGLSLFIVAAIVTMICDLSINVTFNPARALIADLTTAGPHRVRGCTWMQTISGILGIAAYFISISLGNYALIIITAALVFTLSIAPLLFITEIPPSSEKLSSTQQHNESLKNGTAFRALMPMSGFLFFGIFRYICRRQQAGVRECVGQFLQKIVNKISQ